MQDISGWVLAGGKSTRMGNNKALLEFEGKSLLLHAVEKLQPVCSTVGVVGGEVTPPGFPLYRDLLNCGPLGGIATALQSSRTDWNLFLPVDMPLIPTKWLQKLVSQIGATEALAIVTRAEEKPQPLVATYHRSLFPKLEQAILHQNYKVMSAVCSATEVFYLETQESALFANVNTPEEFAAMQKVMG